MKSKLYIAATIGLIFISSLIAGDKIPEKALPLSKIVKTLEDKGFNYITDISMDNTAWEVEVTKDGQERELKVNPLTAEIISNRVDD